MIYRTEISTEKYRAKEYFKKLIDSEQIIEIKNVGKKRSLLLNASMHFWFTLIANDLNDSGQYMNLDFYKGKSQVSWTLNSIKEVFFRPIMVAMFGIESTTELTNKQTLEVVEEIHRILGETFQISVEFPNKDYNAEY